MTEIFKTNVQNKTQARQILSSLNSLFTEAKINFDLLDCDKILRAKGINEASVPVIISGVNNMGYHCEVLN
jgi:tRNA G26 N,N-dimethylase Trm1